MTSHIPRSRVTKYLNGKIVADRLPLSMDTRRSPNGHLLALRALDLDGIDVVGFDLDHTLALYDDPAVNALAVRAASRYLVDKLGYPGALAEWTPPGRMSAGARSIAIDFDHGALVKLDAQRRVRLGRRHGEWVDADLLARMYPETIPDTTDRVHHIYSPFDVPTLWLFEAMADVGGAPESHDAALVCRDVRRMLDLAHTDGTLKTRLLADLPALVSGLPGMLDRLEAWRRAGKRLFVATNSERDYAAAVMDHALGVHWRDVFEVVAVSSRKPAFFADPPGVANPVVSSVGRATVIEEASAYAIESMFRVEPERILYVGDNARADIRPARRRGWRTVHVVSELGARAEDLDDWGAALAHRGMPTWFAQLIRDHADAVCDRADRLLSSRTDSPLYPAGELAVRSAFRESP
jgi:HAD superfamily 5'-nucleotidase-like hydrolase